MVNAGGQPTIRKQKMFLTLSSRMNKKQTTVAENTVFALKKYVPRNNSPDVLADSQKYYQSNSIVQQYEQEKNYAYMIVIAKKTEKQILVICIIEQHKDSNDRSGKNSPLSLLT